METLILVRHAFAGSNRDGNASCAVPGEGLTPDGVEQARALAQVLSAERDRRGGDLAPRPHAGDAGPRAGRTRRPRRRRARARRDRLRRLSRRTARHVPSLGARTAAGPASAGGGESRADAAARFARGLRVVLARDEATVLLVGHALALRYVLDAAGGLSACGADDTGGARVAVPPRSCGRRAGSGAPRGMEPRTAVSRSLERRTSRVTARPTSTVMSFRLSGVCPPGRARPRRSGLRRWDARPRALEPIGFEQLAQSASTSADATSGRFSFDLSMSFPGTDEPFAFSGEGAFDERSGRASFAVDMSSLAKLLGGFVAGLGGTSASGLPDFDDPSGWKIDVVQDGDRRLRAPPGVRRTASGGQDLDPGRRRRRVHAAGSTSASSSSSRRAIRATSSARFVP